MKNRMDRSWWLAAVVLLGVVFGLIELQQSLRAGLLAFPPAYDNNGYLVEALGYAKALFNGGSLALGEALYAQPPHAPISTAMAVAGFALFGVEAWTPNLVQVIEPAILVLIVDRLGRDCSRWLRAAVMLAALTAPVSRFLIQEDRPDVLWGMLIAGGITVALTREAVRGERGTLRVAGALLGCAWLAKPTLLPVNIVMTGCAVALLAALRIGFREPALFAWPAWRPLVGPFVVITVPYFAIGWRPIAQYVYQVVFSPQADDWLLRTPGSFWTEMRFYLVGPGGEAMLGPWLWAFPVIATAAVALAVVRRDRLTLSLTFALACALLVSFAAIALPRLKSSFFGTGFSYLLIFATIQAAFALATAGRQAVARTTTGVLTILAIVWSSCTFSFNRPPYDPALAYSALRAGRDWNAALQRLLRALPANGVTHGDVFLTNIYFFLNEHTLHFLNDQAGISDNRFIALYRSRNTSEYLDALSRAEAVIEVKAMPASDNIVPAAVREALGAELKADPMLRLKQRIEFEGDTIAEIYVRVRPFQGYQVLSGLSAEEMVPPTPGATPRPVHWGLGPTSEFQVTVPASGHLLLTASGDAPGGSHDPIAVSVDVRPQGELAVSKANATLVLSAPPGPATVRFAYQHWLPPAGAETRALAVLFSTLRFEDAP